MRSVNKFCARTAILLFIISAVKSSDPMVLSNISNSSAGGSMSKIASTNSSTGASGCNCPPVYCDAQANANAGASSSSCFASDTLVTLTNHKRIPIHQLRSGDELFTTDGTTIFTTQMMMMLDKSTFSQAMFQTIVTASGHSVSLTALHLIPIIKKGNTFIYVPAKEVKVGDVLSVMSDDRVMLTPVIKVIVEMKTGYYAPSTTSGTLLVNGIMASCYSNVQSHEAAQWYMGPLRWYYWLAQSLSLNEPFGDYTREGLHFVPQVMYEFGRIFRPSTLRFA